MKRLRGFKSLVQAAVDQGSRAIERVQIETAKVPFDLAEHVPGLKVPAGGARLIYNTGVSSVHTMIRLVTKVAGDTLDVVLDAVEQRAPPAGDEEPAAGNSEAPAGDSEAPAGDSEAPAGDSEAPADDSEAPPAQES